MAKNSTARISVNKLGEYMVSRGPRQRRILRDQKFREDFKGMYYREATEAIATCLASGLEDTAILERTLRRLEQQTPAKVGTQRRLAANADAIETFDSMLDQIDLMGAIPTLGAHKPPKLKVQNVEISVRPEIVLKSEGKSGRSLIGGVKLHFSRTFPLAEESAGYVSAIIQEFGKSYLVESEETFGPYCFVIDVGSKTVYPGVKATANRMKAVVAECRNILAIWDSITEND